MLYLNGNFTRYLLIYMAVFFCGVTIVMSLVPVWHFKTSIYGIHIVYSFTSYLCFLHKLKTATEFLSVFIYQSKLYQQPQTLSPSMNHPYSMRKNKQPPHKFLLT